MKERILCTLRWGLPVAVLFCVVYGGADWVTAHRTLRIPVHTQWELALPLWPWMILVYMSIYPLMWAAPFMLDSTRQIRALCWSLGAVILAAGVGFLLCPAQLAFSPPPADMGIWTGLFRFADWLNLDYNLVPSLHVALAVTCVSAYTSHGNKLWWLWGALIAASTLLTHQHHVIDVASGWLLGIAGGRLYRGINQSQL